MPQEIIWSWYTGRWRVGCYIWYSEEGTGRGPSPPRPLLTVPNVTAHPSTASVPITVLLCTGPLLCGFNVDIKGLKEIYLSLVCRAYLPRSIYSDHITPGLRQLHWPSSSAWKLAVLTYEAVRGVYPPLTPWSKFPPTLPLPFPSSLPSPLSSLSLPSLPLPSLPLPLEVGPLIAARGSRGALGAL